MKRILFSMLILCLLALSKIFAQEANKIELGFGFSGYIPIGELKEYYGGGVLGDFSVNYNIANKSRLSLSLGFVNSDNVKQDVLSQFRTSNGSILDQDGFTSQIITRMTGWVIGANYSRNILSLGDNDFSKLFVGIGAGIFQHHIKFNDFSQVVPLINGDYYKGFDRNSIGPYLEQTIGYRLLKGRLNFDFGIRALQGFTKVRIPVNFDGVQNPTQRTLNGTIGVFAKCYIELRSVETGKDVFY